uniref:Rho GTPase n=1 Tax=Acrobeloides nanus TaxID=290746 RepID=A0A914DM08_9BILA
MKKNLKLVVVGDGACGKTSLIIAHAGGEFSDNYIPTAFDDYIIETYVEGKAKHLTVCDTAGEDDFNKLRPLSYPDADVFIVCYSVERPESIKNIRESWIPEIRHFCPHTPIVLVGNKKDIRDETRRKMSKDIEASPSTSTGVVDRIEAEECAKEFSQLPLIECSAKTRENVRQVFDTALAAAIAYRNRKKNKVIQSIMKLRLVF